MGLQRLAVVCMLVMLRRRHVFASTVPAVLMLTMCQEATAIRVEVTTTAKCSDISGTTIAVGHLGEIEGKPAASSVRTCDPSTGSVGSLVILPSGDEDGEVAFKIVSGVRQNVESCTPPDYKGCIVVRRALRFVPHEEITVQIVMDLQCLDVPCGALDTCFQGRCTSARCAGSDGCPETPADGGRVDGFSGDVTELPDTTLPMEAGPEAAIDAGAEAATEASVDAATCAPCASSLHKCVDTTCVCSATSCTIGDRRCSAGGNTVEQCALDVPDGCGVWTASTTAGDTCGPHEQCVGAGSNASCACTTGPCSSAGATCVSTAAVGSCAQDSDGCFFVASSANCAAPLTCQVKRCGCDTAADCLVGNECSAALRTCLADSRAPSIQRAFLIAADTVRVRYSEPVTNANATSAYCIEVFDGNATACAATTDFAITSVSSIDTRTYDVKLSAAAAAKRYAINASNVFDAAGNAIGSPSYGEFTGLDALRVVTASSLGSTSFDLHFSAPVIAGPNVAASAGCTSAVECAKRYKLAGPTPLGTITSAVVQAAPQNNRVVVTHSGAQSGALYTVLVANGTNGDGFDNAAFGAIGRVLPAGAVQASPSDRALFLGRGKPIATVADGPFAEDAFADASTGAFVFSHRGRVYIGPNKDGRAAARFHPQGDHPELVTFAFTKDTNATGGGTSANAAAAPYASIGFAGCTADVSCGPDNEDGRGRFASGIVSGAPWLIIGGARSASQLDYFYMSSDDDTRLDFKYVDVTNITGGNTKGFSEVATFNNRVYLGLPDTGGKKPYLLDLLAPPASGATGLDANVNGTGNSCVPGTHQACNLDADALAGVGSTTFVDVIYGHADRLYVANTAGIVRSRNNAPLNYSSNPTHWTTITPTAAAYSSKTSVTSNKTSDILPSDKAWPAMTTFSGRLYAARNTTTGPQLWRCDPTVSSAPAPATAADCDPTDWVRIAANGTGDALLSQFDDATLTRVTLLAASGSYLYVGFDSASGVALYRTNVPIPNAAADFEGDAGCVAGTVGCKGIGNAGFGRTGNARFYEAATATEAGRSFLYFVTGNGTVGARVYRMTND